MKKSRYGTIRSLRTGLSNLEIKGELLEWVGLDEILDCSVLATKSDEKNRFEWVLFIMGKGDKKDVYKLVQRNPKIPLLYHLLWLDELPFLKDFIREQPYLEITHKCSSDEEELARLRYAEEQAYNVPMEKLDKKDPIGLVELERQVNAIFDEEFRKLGLQNAFARTRALDERTVGVQGDNRTYDRLVEVEIRCEGKPYWDEKLAERLSNRITNEVAGVNRVVYTTAIIDDKERPQPNK